MLALVWDRERTAGEIAREAGLSAPATSQHLRVLREAGLVSVRAQANRRLYRAEPERVAGLRAALEAFWGQRLPRPGGGAAARGRLARGARGVLGPAARAHARRGRGERRRRGRARDRAGRAARRRGRAR